MKYTGNKIAGWISIWVLAGTVLACSLTGAPATEIATLPTIVAATLQALITPTSPAPTSAATSEPGATQAGGTQVSFANVSFIIPTGLASGAASEAVSAVSPQSGAPWEVAPAFSRFTLQGYPLQDKFFQPQIMVYPAQEYASTSDGAAMSIQRLQAILANPSGPISIDALPHLPYANAAQVFGALPKLVTFNGGQGVRVLAIYAQFFSPVNNHDLFYHFEGLTSDGKYYVVAVLPVNAAFLPADSNPAAPVPTGGVPFPAHAYDATTGANYYQAVTDKFNATSADAFQPTLILLDSFIQSLKVNP